MNDDKSSTPKDNENAGQEKEQETITVKNPFKPGEEREINPEELDKEQEYKEALTERD